ncbi:TIGR02679 family protein [Kutzneria albida]|uniref:TIGR02679 family protein n=1 Tax=Kutzneria albida DSM 43870 TaxID=1449976 RepID=W5WCW2_9PSEU|nr:TIGR02679 family protein [Kutzneria albida]AHH98672.1 hypothetical protein KALB_5310 [Kutzneria albida DSM 43870]
MNARKSAVDWLAQPALARMWHAVRTRLERNGVEAKGRIQLVDLTDVEAEALGLLLGQRCNTALTRISLATLDRRLRDSAAECGLIELVGILAGPLQDLKGARAARAAQWAEVWTAGADLLAAHDLGDLAGWLETERSSGGLRRLDPGEAAEELRRAITVLARLSTGDRSVISRTELAAQVTGNAHGLDDDTVLARLVLRAIAVQRAQPVPVTAGDRRSLWRAADVLADQVSATVLTYGLAPHGQGWREGALRDRAAHNAEVHLTARDVCAIRWELPAHAREVWVCENPTVVEAAADARCGRPLICTSGNPATVVLLLLDALCATGARLHYRGDFDWPGIAIANRFLTRYRADTWLMDAVFYDSAVTLARDRGSPLWPLSEASVEASWDPELAPALAAIGVAVHEESVLEQLVDHLNPPERATSTGS